MQTSSSIIVTVQGTFTVTSTVDGCTSLPGSGTAAPKISPENPVESVDCSLGFGEAVITILSPLGTGFEYRLDGGGYQTGTSFKKVKNGSHTITVRNPSGCTATGNYFEVSCGCVNGSIVTLSSASGSTCSVVPATVSGNSFGGSATYVLITEDGDGQVNPSIAYTTPFSFTYTPVRGDAGKTVKITVTTNNPPGGPCVEAKETYLLNVSSNPVIPVAETVLNPTCSLPTGSVLLTGLPATGTWTLTRFPGGITTSGSGASTTVSDLQSGIYRFSVTNENSCISESSAEILISSQPQPPAAPVQSVNCSQGYGKAVVSVTSPVGAGLEYSLDGGTFTISTSFTNVKNGNHIITARNSSGCTASGISFLVGCGCENPPSLTLSSISGKTCGKIPVTVSGNIFGGGATSVNISINGTGSGTLSPISLTTSPFTFTYTPSPGDEARKVVITLTTNNPFGTPCEVATAAYTLTVYPESAIPIIGSVTQISCTESTGSIVLNNLPQNGIWTVTQNPGLVTKTGTGSSTRLSGLEAGSYAFTVTNSDGCISLPSASVVLIANPGNPLSPIVGTITPPGCMIPEGSVILNGLPANGTWTLTRYPGTVTSVGSGTSINITGLTSGTFNFTVTNGSGCLSAISKDIIIPAKPIMATVVVKDPEPVCITEKVDLTNPSLTEGSSNGTIFTYWSDVSATIPYPTPSAAGAGTYYIKGTNTSGCLDIKPVKVSVRQLPVADAGPDIFLNNSFETTMDAVIDSEDETGKWSLISGSSEFSDSTSAKTIVSKLSMNENIFLWTVTNIICPESSDTMMIKVQDQKISTLITPNMDGRNDFFVLEELTSGGKTELIIFDRRGVKVYKNENYDNSWNGSDYNGNPLQDDTYFYVLRTENGRSLSGFIVIRR
jgi:gliding motility-associated-like protein